MLWVFLRRYYPLASPETHPRLDSLVRYAVTYFRDFVAPKKHYREADDVERGVLMKISSTLSQLSTNASAEEVQHALYDIARPIPRYQDHSAKGATTSRPGVSNEFFNMIYAILLGDNRGPRLGSFIAIYGLNETRQLIQRRWQTNWSKKIEYDPCLGPPLVLSSSPRCAFQCCAQALACPPRQISYVLAAVARTPGGAWPAPGCLGRFDVNRGATSPGRA